MLTRLMVGVSLGAGKRSAFDFRLKVAVRRYTIPDVHTLYFLTRAFINLRSYTMIDTPPVAFVQRSSKQAQKLVPANTRPTTQDRALFDG